MNFLAHCVLADNVGAGSGGLVGGVLGDFVKGPVDSSLPRDIALGVRLHRRVDALSNRLPGILDSIRRFPPPHRRYAPIYVDILADHLLARSFDSHSQMPLRAFSEHCYAALAAERARFPDSALRFVDWMTENDLFGRYTELDAALEALASLSRRMRRPPDQTGLDAVISGLLPALEDDFTSYFPALRQALERSPECAEIVR